MDKIDKITEKKRFKKPRTYYAEFVFLGVFIAACLFATLFSLYWMSDEMLYDFATRELAGTAQELNSQLALRTAVRTAGREGLAFLFIFFSIMASFALRREIKEYRRYKRYLAEGAIDEIYDD